MLSANRLLSPVMLVCCVLASTAVAPHAFSKVPASIATEMKLGNDENTFTFAGLCPNGETYRIFSYQKMVENVPQSFYDYEGPVGKGTVRTTASAKTMAVRVCRKLAEIVNTNYWE